MSWILCITADLPLIVMSPMEDVWRACNLSLAGGRRNFDCILLNAFIDKPMMFPRPADSPWANRDLSPSFLFGHSVTSLLVYLPERRWIQPDSTRLSD